MKLFLEKNNRMTVRLKSIFLVIDSNPADWESVLAALKDSALEIRCIDNEEAAVEFLLTSDKGVACVVLNPSVSKPAGLPVVRHVYEARPTVPIYLAPDKAMQFSDLVLSRLGVRRVLDRKKLLEEASTILKALEFRPDEAIKASREISKEKVNETSSLSDEHFHPIRSQDFMSGSKSIFDVFVRLGANRYVKILQSGDSFSKERIMTYLNKGVTSFYIPKAMQKNYLSFCDELIKNISASQKLPAEFKLKQIANLGQETAIFLADAGVTTENLELARNYAASVDQMVRNLGDGKHQHILNFMKDMLTYEHSVGLVMVSSLMLGALGFERHKSVETIGVACLLHDIGLQAMPDKIKTEDELLMSDEEIKIFHTHPIVGADILGAIRGIEPSVVGSVLQHHERRSGKGFPFQKSTGTVQRIAEIIGICDEFLLLMRRVTKDPELNLQKELDAKIFNGFSYQVVDAFRKTVIPMYKTT